MVGATLGAIPLSHVESQAFKPVAADVAGLAAGPEAVNLAKSLAIPLGLVLQHPGSHADPSIRKALGHTVVLNHAPEVEVFDIDVVESANKFSGHLVQAVLSAVRDSGLNPGNPKALPMPPPATFYPAGQDALVSGQFALLLSQVSGVGDSLPVGERSQPRQPEVNTHGLAGLGQLLNGLVKAKSHKVAPSAVLGYRDRAGAALKLSAPTDVEPAELGYCKVAVHGIPLKGRNRVLCGLLASLGFEARVAAALREEVGVGRLEMPEDLLERHATDFIEPGRLFLLLEFGQERRGLMVADLLAGAVGVAAELETPVVDEPDAAKGPGQNLLLVGSGVEPEAETHLHINSLAHVSQVVKAKGKEVALPPHA